MFIEKGALNMNFNSPQLLAFFKIWYPTLGGTGVKRTKETETPCDRVVQKKFTKASKLVSSFGRKMFNYIEKRMVGEYAGFSQLVPLGLDE
jgi:hypothetical protein